MYLKSLELHGFKSFPERTVLKFNSGTTVIVGPNGSGKSNITDAMRWVLGELSSRNIRGSKMEDVIFAGASDKKPMSFAEVSVTFDNSGEQKTLQSDYDEVTVTRRYYRSGESVYFINRKKVRLKDIYELFMNTGIGREGYSIIGQGKIAEIISKKSEDRRTVFEESAGIAKYRYKKNESEKKLKETEANMERVGDIERELAMRIGPLERDSEKARKYLELYGEKKKTDISLWMYDSVRLKNAIEKAENDMNLSAHELEMAEDSINLTSAKIERLFDMSSANKEASRRNFEETSEATKLMHSSESESKVLTKERIHSERTLESEKRLYEASERARVYESDRLEEITLKLKDIEAKFTEAQGAYDSVAVELTALDEKINEKTGVLENLLVEQRNAEAALTDLRVRLNVLENNIQNQKKRTDSINSDIKKYEEEIAGLDKLIQSALNQISQYNTAIEEINARISTVADRIEELTSVYDGIEARQRKKQAELDSLDSRIAALSRMQEHFDGYNNSIRFVMSESRDGRLSGIRGPLSYLIKVQDKYIVAIETALGSAMQNIVTDDEDAAKRSIEALKRNNAGRATFYPLSTIRPQERGRDYDGLDKTAGFVGWADELVSCDEDYRNIVKSLLTKVAVYNNLDNATVAARSKGWRVRCVTLDGQQINAGGSFTGGQTKRESGMLSRTAQIDSLKSERDEAAKELNAIVEEANTAKANIAAVTSESAGDEERKSLIEALISAENKSLGDAEGKKKAIVALVDNMKADTQSLIESSTRSTDDLNKLNEMINAQAEYISSTDEKRNDIAVERGELELAFAELTEKSNGLRITLAELNRDKEATETALGETKQRLDDYTSASNSHKEAISTLEDSIKSLADSAETRLKEADDFKEKITELADKQKMLEKAGDEIEMQISQLRQAEKEQNAKKEIIFISHSKNENKLNSLRDDEHKLSAKMWDDYELTFAAATKFAEENDCHVILDGERTAFVAKQTELRNKIKGLGHVNVDAIEEYVDVKARYEYINTQLSDLRASKEDLLKVLNGIEEDMKNIFLEAFEKINTYFGEVFRELFGGGHAEVRLTDPENALESGIEINAAPPGKTIKNLNLLSGGEQAFIAIALLFALIKVNPSPFCIFDEIEAALDEVNVTRVGRYVKKYSDEMQIIMISHRRGTMDIADTLYGVTMQQSGVSKVFTLNSNEDGEALLN